MQGHREGGGAGRWGARAYAYACARRLRWRAQRVPTGLGVARNDNLTWHGECHFRFQASCDAAIGWLVPSGMRDGVLSAPARGRRRRVAAGRGLGWAGLGW